MRCQDDHLIQSRDVRRGQEVHAKLSDAPVLRFERKFLAMTGTPHLVAENGQLAVHFADGASVYLTD